jgi:hypothetical protein
MPSSQCLLRFQSFKLLSAVSFQGPPGVAGLHGWGRRELARIGKAGSAE